MIGLGILAILFSVLFPDPVTISGNTVSLPQWARLLIIVAGIISIVLGFFFRLKDNGKNGGDTKQAISRGNIVATQQNVADSITMRDQIQYNVPETKTTSIYPHEKVQYAVREIPKLIPTFGPKRYATFLMLWISNNKTARVDAEDVSAEMVFNNLTGRVVGPIVAIWENVEETARGMYGQLIDQVRRTDIRVNLPANGLPARIILALKNQDEDDGYAFNLESTGIQNWTNPMLVIPPSQYKLTIELRGKNIEPNPTVLNYDLTVLGAGDTFEITPSSKEET